MSIKQSITTTIGRAGLQTKKQSPHIFFIVGLGGALVSTVLACRATLKLEDTVDAIKKDFEHVHAQRILESYSESDYRRDLSKAYVSGANRLIKLYGPAGIVGTLSIVALTGSHIQMSQRNAALTAAFTAVSRSYEEYRGRVREELGEEKEQAIYEGCLLDDMEDAEDLASVMNKASSFGRIFEPNNVNWVHNLEMNRFFIECQKNYANLQLQAKGHVFLNDVYDLLGFDRTSEGAVLGWIRNKGDEPEKVIDFGLYDAINVHFINGNARGCVLDFHPDGVIFDKI